MVVWRHPTKPQSAVGSGGGETAGYEMASGRAGAKIVGLSDPLADSSATVLTKVAVAVARPSTIANLKLQL